MITNKETIQNKLRSACCVVSVRSEGKSISTCIGWLSSKTHIITVAHIFKKHEGQYDQIIAKFNELYEVKVELIDMTIISANEKVDYYAMDFAILKILDTDKEKIFNLEPLSIYLATPNEIAIIKSHDFMTCRNIKMPRGFDITTDITYYGVVYQEANNKESNVAQILLNSGTIGEEGYSGSPIYSCQIDAVVAIQIAASDKFAINSNLVFASPLFYYDDLINKYLKKDGLILNHTFRIPNKIDKFGVPNNRKVVPISKKREEELDKVLSLHGRVVLNGTQGIGKTETALGYNEKFEGNVIWFDCHSNESLDSNIRKYFKECFGQVNVSDDAKEVISRYFMEINEKTLIVFDDANEDKIQEWIISLPLNKYCQYIVTTYHPSNFFTESEIFEIPCMSQKEGYQLFLQHIPDQYRVTILKEENDYSHVNEYSAAIELVNFCGGLPLAIQQVGKLVKNHFGCRSLLSSLQKEKLLGENMDSVLPVNLSGLHPGVFSTFKMTYNTIIDATKDDNVEREVFQVAVRLLQYISFLDSSSLDIAFLNQLDYADLKTDSKSQEYLLPNAIGILSNYGLVEQLGDGEHLTTKGVIQQVIRLCMIKDEQKLIIDKISIFFRNIFSERTMGLWNYKDTPSLLIHMSAFLSFSKNWYQSSLSKESILFLQCELGEFHFEIGAYENCTENFSEVISYFQDKEPTWVLLKAWIGLAMNEELMGSYKNAEGIVKKIETYPKELKELTVYSSKDYARFYLLCAYLFSDKSRWKTAQRYIHKAIKYLESKCTNSYSSYELMLLYGCLANVQFNAKSKNRLIKKLFRKKASESYSKAFKYGDICKTQVKEIILYALYTVKNNYSDLLIDIEKFEEAEKILLEGESIYNDLIFQAYFPGNMTPRFYQSHIYNPHFANMNHVDYAYNQIRFISLYIDWYAHTLLNYKERKREYLVKALNHCNCFERVASISKMPPRLKIDYYYLRIWICLVESDLDKAIFYGNECIHEALVSNENNSIKVKEVCKWIAKHYIKAVEKEQNALQNCHEVCDNRIKTIKLLRRYRIVSLQQLYNWIQNLSNTTLFNCK